MRLDKFINSVNITKRRTIAKDMIINKAIFVNGKEAKVSKEVKVGDIIKIKYLNNSQSYEILQIPRTKSIAKSKKDEYIKEI